MDGPQQQQKQQVQEFQALCERLHRNDARLTIIDRAFYYRFCSLLCDRSNKELVTNLAASLAKNTRLESLLLDGAILLHNEETPNHLHLLNEHLLCNSHNLRNLTLRWCGTDPELLTAVARNPSLHTLHMKVQGTVDLQPLLATTRSLQSISIRSSATVRGLGPGMKQNLTLKDLRLLVRLEDDTMSELCQALQQNEKSSLTSLQVKVLSTSQANSLCEFLLSPNCCLRELDLSNSDLREMETQLALLRGIAGNKYLKKLVLNQSSLGRSATGLHRPAWLNAFAKNRSLETLLLASNFLKSSDVATVVEALAPSPTLQHLDLTMNLLPSEACVALSTALQSARWSKLAISGMEFASSLQAKVLKKALAKNTYLKELVLGRLWFSTDDQQDKQLALRSILQGLVNNTSLETISTDGFGNKPEDVRDLLVGLSLRKNIKSLVLRESRFHSDVCNPALLCLLLSQNPLEELDFGKHTFDESTVQMLSQALRVNKSLKVLRLYQCQTEGRDWKALFEALEKNQTLEFLDLQCVFAKKTDGHRILSQFYRSLPRMKGLKRLSFHGPAGYTPREEVIPKFLLALEQNFNIEDVTTNVTGKHEQKMEYILDLNKSGRRLLRATESLPSAVWPQYLAHMAAQKDPTMLFYTLGTSLQKWNPPKDTFAVPVATVKPVTGGTTDFASNATAQGASTKPPILFAKSA